MPDDPRPTFTPDWPTCVLDECRGIQSVGKLCLQHRDTHSMPLPGKVLDLRGTVFDAALCDELLASKELWAAAEEARFDWALFEEVVLIDLQFDGRIRFDYAWFRGKTEIERLTCDRLTFHYARFEHIAHLLDVEARHVDLIHARFMDAATVEVRAPGVRISNSRFEGPANIEFLEAHVMAENMVFGAPASIKGNPAFGPMPKLLCLSGDIGKVVLGDIDLRSCEFDGAHGLDHLRMDGRVEFGTAPGRFRARRRVLADESSWRGWTQGSGTDRASPERLAVTYRSLRKSFEDSKNEAGAGDFYYGEMEMRRHSSETSRAEKTILWFYWLFSGYGQRASRALAALFVVVATVTTLLTVWGQDFGLAARIAVGAVVFRADDTDLTAAGEWTVLVARFLGPVLLALAVLAVRARVKR